MDERFVRPLIVPHDNTTDDRARGRRRCQAAVRGRRTLRERRRSVEYPTDCAILCHMLNS